MRHFSKDTFINIKRKAAGNKDPKSLIFESSPVLDKKNRPAFILAILAILVIVWSVWRSDKNGEKIISPQVIPAEAGKSDVTNVRQFAPLNGKEEVVSSYTAVYPSSTAKQTTVVFISNNDADKNFDFYLKWAKDNSWVVANSAKGDAAVYSIYLKKPGERMNITLNKQMVTITHVELKS